MQEIFFTDIIKGRKITALNGQNYRYTQVLDGVIVGRPDGDLSINFITPVNPDAADSMKIIADSLGKDELTIVLKPNVTVSNDIQNYLKTFKYLAQNPPASQQDAARRGLLESRQSNQRALRVQIEEAISKMISEAHMYVRGTEISPRSTEPLARITEGFSDLAVKVYANYPMVADMSGLQESDIVRFLRNSSTSSDTNEESEAERELLSTINLNAQLGINNTMHTVVEKFEKKPYGWPLAVIECLVAKLLGKGKLGVNQCGETVPSEKLADVLRNTRTHESLILQPQTEIAPQQIRKLKDFARDFFRAPIAQTEAKHIASDVHTKLSEELRSWESLLARSSEFPFVKGLMPLIEKVRRIVNQPPLALYSSEIVTEYAALIELKEMDADKIVSIINGPQRTIFQSAHEFVRTEEGNFSKLRDEGEEGHAVFDKFSRLSALIESPDIYKGTGLVQVKPLHSELKTDLATALEKVRSAAQKVIDEKADSLRSRPEYAQAGTVVQERVTRATEEIKSSIAQERQITAIQGNVIHFEQVTYLALMREIFAAACPSEGGEVGGNDEAASRVQIVPYSSVVSGYKKPVIVNNADVDDYLAFVRERLGAALADGKRIVFN